MPLTRDAFLAARPLKIEPVALPEFGDHVFVRPMTVGERDAFDFANQKAAKGKAEDMRGFRARLLVRCLCDEKGSLLFAPADAPFLCDLPGNSLEPAVEKALRLNGFTTGAGEGND